MLSGGPRKINFTVCGLMRLGFESTIYCTRGQHANHYTITAVLKAGLTVPTPCFCIETLVRCTNILSSSFILALYFTVQNLANPSLYLQYKICKNFDIIKYGYFHDTKEIIHESH
jgi:hypothetical protein